MPRLIDNLPLRQAKSVPQGQNDPSPQDTTSKDEKGNFLPSQATTKTTTEGERSNHDTTSSEDIATQLITNPQLNQQTQIQFQSTLILLDPLEAVHRIVKQRPEDPCPINKLSVEMVNYMAYKIFDPSTAAILALTNKFFYYTINPYCRLGHGNGLLRFQFLKTLNKSFPFWLNCHLCQKMHDPLPRPELAGLKTERLCDFLHRSSEIHNMSHNMIVGLPENFRFDFVQLALEYSRRGWETKHVLKCLEASVTDIKPKLNCAIAVNVHPRRLRAGPGRYYFPASGSGRFGRADIQQHNRFITLPPGPATHQIIGLHENCTLRDFRSATYIKKFVFQTKIVNDNLMSRSQQWIFINELHFANRDSFPTIQFSICPHFLYSDYRVGVGREVINRLLLTSESLRNIEPTFLQCGHCETDFQLDSTLFNDTNGGMYVALVLTTWKNFGSGRFTTSPQFASHRFGVASNIGALLGPENMRMPAALVKIKRDLLPRRTSLKSVYEQGNTFSFWNGGVTENMRNELRVVLAQERELSGE